MRSVKSILKWIGILLTGLIVLVLIALALVNTPPGKRLISKIATEKMHREVTLSGGIGIPLSWPPAIRVRGLTVANMAGGKAAKMVDIGELQLAVAPGALFRHQLEIPYIKLHDSTINLERNADKHANWMLTADQPQEKKEDKPFQLPMIGALDLKNSHVTYLDVPQKIDIAIDGGSKGDDVVISGGGMYQAQKFDVKAEAGSLLNVVRHEPYPIDTTVTIGHTTMHAKGTVDDPTNFAGLDIALQVKGASASDLFPLIGLVLPPTPPYDVTGQLSFEKDSKIWKFQHFKGRLGGSDLNGDLAFAMGGARPKLTANFVSNKLDFKDLGPLVGTPPEKAKAVSPEQKQKVAKAEASPFVIPDTPLDVSRLKAMDADVTFTGKQILSPSLPLDNFYLKVDLDDRLLKINPVKFGTADGDIKAILTIDGRREPFATDADFMFRKLSLNRLLETAGKKIGESKVADGYIGGHAKLSGQGKSLHQILGSSTGAVGIGMQGGDISNLIVELIGLDVAQGLGFFFGGDKTTGIRCIIGDFGVTDGMMKSNALVIDTNDTNIQGDGTINLKNEALNLRLKAKPKDTSFASLRTPFDIQGTMKHPDVSLEKKDLVEKGAAAVAIGVVLTPIASILGFVDPSHGKDSDCGKLYDEMKAHTSTSDASSHVPVNATQQDKPLPKDQ